MKQFIGIPFRRLGRDRAGVDCWGLVMLVYRDLFGIELPDLQDIATDRHDYDVEVLDGPAEGCLVRVTRCMPLAEHWGIYFHGNVLQAQQPNSAMVPLSRFMRHSPDVQFIKVMHQ